MVIKKLKQAYRFNEKEIKKSMDTAYTQDDKEEFRNAIRYLAKK